MDYKEVDVLISFNGEEVNGVNAKEIMGRFTANDKDGDNLTVQVKREMRK